MRIRGFTLIELLVVLAIIGTLLSLAVPRYIGSVDKAKESVLRENIASLRESIDKYYADRGAYPTSLDELVAKRYLRHIPPDPVTDSDRTWVIVPPPEPLKGAVFDIRSGAQGKGLDGTAYRDW